MAMTLAQKNRSIRQDNLREQLAGQGHLQHLLDIAEKLAKPEVILDALMINRYRIVIETKLKLLNKYLPDLKNVEISGDANNPIVVIKNLSGDKAYDEKDEDSIIEHDDIPLVTNVVED